MNSLSTYSICGLDVFVLKRIREFHEDHVDRKAMWEMWCIYSVESDSFKQ